MPIDQALLPLVTEYDLMTDILRRTLTAADEPLPLHRLVEQCCAQYNKRAVRPIEEITVENMVRRAVLSGLLEEIRVTDRQHPVLGYPLPDAFRYRLADPPRTS